MFKAAHEHKGAIKNLMQFYMYDFSRFIPLDVKEDGLFEPYLNLDSYGTKKVAGSFTTSAMLTRWRSL